MECGFAPLFKGSAKRSKKQDGLCQNACDVLLQIKTQG